MKRCVICGNFSSTSICSSCSEELANVSTAVVNKLVRAIAAKHREPKYKKMEDGCEPIDEIEMNILQEEL